MVRLVTDDDIGLKVLREAPAEASEIVDIVAVHGIGAHPDDTWCKNVGTRENPWWVNWLDAEDMLPAVAPHTRIMRYGYQSQWFREGAMQQNMSTVAQRLSLALRQERADHPCRPLLFVAHCFGGLIVLKALLDAQHDDSECTTLLASTTGLIFFSTPFRGTEGISQVEMLASAWCEYQEDDLKTDIIKLHEPENKFLQDLVVQFNKARRQIDKAEVACFYELKSSNVERTVGKADCTRFLVDRSSGCLDLSDATKRFPLSRTHFDMNKFGKPLEEAFETVRDAIKKIIGASHELMRAQSQPRRSFPERCPVRETIPFAHSHISKPIDRYCNFRLRGIPCEYQTRADVRGLVRTILSIDIGTSVTIHSLATSAVDQNSKVATLSFHDIPILLSDSSRNEWVFTLPVDGSIEEADFSWGKSLVFDKHFSGFTPLQHTLDDDCHVDIIALSGLGGHAFGSFKERNGSFMWLRDALPLDVSGARILIYGYDTELIQSSSFQNLTDLGRALLIDMKGIRHLVQSRPIVFIGHSLGGLVIKEAIVKCKEGTEDADASILSSISGFLFFGVPHQGMAIESLVPLVRDNPNRPLLESLNKNSALLQRLENDFNKAFGIRYTRVVSFYETERSPTAVERRDGTWNLSGPSEVLVDVSSATCGSTHHYPINRNHSDIVKYSHQYDGLYQRVIVALQPLVSKQNKPVAGITGAGHNPSLPLSNKNEECLRSLSFPEQEHRFDEIHVAKNTCTWLLEDRQYNTWENKSRGLFWIKGNPGAGKSVLMKFAVKKMICQRPRELVISFFITARGVLLQKTPLGIFRALLNSMLGFFPEYLARLTERFREREKRFGNYQENRWKWSDTELQDFMMEVLTQGTKNRPIVIFIDALDECGKDSAVRLLEYFESLLEEAERRNAELRICFSSRHFPILGLNIIPTISVEERNDWDIRLVIQERLKKIEPKWKRQQIENDILSKAQGGFHWALLVTTRVLDQNAAGIKAEKLHEKLSSTPEALSELYASILNGVAKAEQNQMVKLFQWVLFAERPLAAQELRDALATDKKMSYMTVSELRSQESWSDTLTDFERHVRYISRGLVEFQSREMWERYEPDGEDLDREAQFIHQSVVDYLLDEYFNNVKYSQNDFRSHIGAGNYQISRSCLRYLTLKEIVEETQISQGKLSSKYPLAPYAVRYLFDHLHKVEKDGINQSDILSIIQWAPQSEFLQNLRNLWRVLDPHNHHTPFDWPFIGATALHVLAASGLKSACDAYLRKEGVDVNKRDLGGNTPLLLAIWENHYDIALMFLDMSIEWQSQHRVGDLLSTDGDEYTKDRAMRFIDVNAENNDGDTALNIALMKHAGEVIFKLVEAGADLKYFGDQTALVFYAIGNRNMALLSKLIEYHVNLDGAVYFAVEELFLGPDSMLERSISELLKAGANTTRSLEFGRNPELEDDERELEEEYEQDEEALVLASRRGQTAVVAFLLSQGVSATCRNKNEDFPLLVAVHNGHEEVIRLLLQNEPSAVEMMDFIGRTALDVAVEHKKSGLVMLMIEEGRFSTTNIVLEYFLFEAIDAGRFDTVMEILQKGCNDPSVKSSEGLTPLCLAARNGHEAIVKLLLDADRFEADSEDSNQRTPLAWAAKNGHEGVVKLLLEIDKVDSDAKDNHNRSPLLWAAQKGHKAVVKLLLDTGKVGVNLEDFTGLTPLSWAAKNGHDTVVKLLLDTDMVNVNFIDSIGVTPLSWAAENGHDAIVKLLLDTGKVDINLKNSALSWAAKNGHDTVVKLLLDTDEVDVDLSLAAENGHDTIVKLLLDTGKVNINLKNSAGCTPLSWAAKNGHDTVVRLLLDTDEVNVDLKESTGRTPLSRAAENGHDAIVKLLLDTGKVDIDSKDSAGCTPLSRAAEHGHDAIVKLLFDTDEVNVDVADSTGRTPLSRAAEHGYVAVVKLLLSTGKVDIDSKDSNGRSPISWAAESRHEAIFNKDSTGRTPLSRAAKHRHVAVVKLLLNTGKVDIDSKDSDGRTPLSRAAEHGHVTLVKLLLNTGKVDIDSKDSDGRSPISWALAGGHEAMFNMLLDIASLSH